LLENLRRVVAAVTAGRHDRERASRWVEKMLQVAAEDPAQVVLVLADMVREDPPLTLAFVAELASRLQGQGAALMFPMSWLEHRMAERGQSIDGVFQLVSQDQAANQVAISNSIGSLRLLGATDWRAFVEASSAVEQTLRTDPGGVYPTMDFATRDRYRLAAEAISKQSSLSEVSVARAALDLAKHAESVGGALRMTHLGYYLVGDGRELLERTVRVRWSARRLSSQLGRRFRALGYGGAVLSLTLIGSALLAWQASAAGLGRWSLPRSYLRFACVRANWRSVWCTGR